MKNRVLWKMFALTILTLGIYRLYWFVKTRKELMSRDPKIKIWSPWLFIIPVVFVIMAVGYFVFDTLMTSYDLPAYCATNQTAAECQAKLSAGPVVALYAAIFLVWPLTVLWLWSYSKGVEAATKGKTNFALAMIVLMAVPDGIDILIIQDAYNKLGAKT